MKAVLHLPLSGGEYHNNACDSYKIDKRYTRDKLRMLFWEPIQITAGARAPGDSSDLKPPWALGVLWPILESYAHNKTSRTPSKLCRDDRKAVATQPVRLQVATTVTALITCIQSVQPVAT